MDNTEKKTETVWRQTKRTHYRYGEMLWTSETEYDDNGNEIKLTSYNPDGSIDFYRITEKDKYTEKHIVYNAKGRKKSRTEYKYDANGNVTGCIHYDVNGETTPIYECEYDTNGVLLKSTCYKNGKLDYIEEYSCNGEIIKRTDYDLFDGTVECITEYDEYGNETKQTSFHELEEETYIFKSEYDDNHKLLKQAKFDLSGKMICQEEYEYDCDGNKVKVLFCNSDGDSDVCEYLSCGNEYKVFASKNGEPPRLLSVREYDEYDNEIKYTVYDFSEKIVCVETYEYKKFEVTK